MTELKNAIITVIKVTYKYEAPAAFDTVKKAGYDIYKNNGFWVVRNRTTYKTISLGGYGNYVYIGNHRVKVENIEKVDIINYLNTPYNREYYNTRPEWDTPTRQKVNELKYAKKHVKYHEERIAKLLAELETERKYHIHEVERVVAIRAKYGLLK